MKNSLYNLFFAGAVCVVCSVVLALAANYLRPLQEFNAEIERKKNVLKVLGLYDPHDKDVTTDHVVELYTNSVEEVVLDSAGNPVPDMPVAEAVRHPGYMPLWVRKAKGTFAIPVQGMGLWSMLRGYFALEGDGRTVAGISFYDQKETPGLGAEIERDWFVENFRGKSILNREGKLVSVSVAKAKAEDLSGVDLRNAVDGISGATMTSRGVDDLLRAGLERYRPYLEKRWERKDKEGS